MINIYSIYIGTEQNKVHAILTSKRNASVTFGMPYCINSSFILFKENMISLSDIIPNQKCKFTFYVVSVIIFV